MENSEPSIEKARHEFGLKEFAKCLAIYNAIAPELLNELDGKIIDYCKTYIDLDRKK